MTIAVAERAEQGTLLEQEAELREVEAKLEKGLVWLWGEKPGASPGSEKWKEGRARYDELQKEYRRLRLQVDGQRLPERLFSLYQVLLFCSPPLSLLRYLEEREDIPPAATVYLERWRAILAGEPSPIDNLDWR